MRTQRMLMRDLPPDLRVMAVPALRFRDEPLTLPGCTLRCDEPWRSSALPTSSVLSDRSLALTITAGQSPAEALLGAVAAGALEETASDVFAAVSVLAAWDDVFERAGLWTSRVYTASETDVGKLLERAGAVALAPGVLATMLDDLQALELIYRFPVARKFRGEFGNDNQCRLNGWGRLLASRFDELGVAVAQRAAWRSGLEELVADHRAAYDEHFAALRRGELAGAWDRCAQLPIGVLI